MLIGSQVADHQQPMDFLYPLPLDFIYKFIIVLNPDVLQTVISAGKQISPMFPYPI